MGAQDRVSLCLAPVCPHTFVPHTCLLLPKAGGALQLLVSCLPDGACGITASSAPGAASRAQRAPAGGGGDSRLPLTILCGVFAGPARLVLLRWLVDCATRERNAGHGASVCCAPCSNTKHWPRSANRGVASARTMPVVPWLVLYRRTKRRTNDKKTDPSWVLLVASMALLELTRQTPNWTPPPFLGSASSPAIHGDVDRPC
eukprot:365817-Chlamydomonas_euryale.AAC.41